MSIWKRNRHLHTMSYLFTWLISSFWTKYGWLSHCITDGLIRASKHISSICLLLKLETPKQEKNIMNTKYLNSVITLNSKPWKSSLFTLTRGFPMFPHGINHFPANPGQREKFDLKFYFHTSLWCLKRFYDGL